MLPLPYKINGAPLLPSLKLLPKQLMPQLLPFAAFGVFPNIFCNICCRFAYAAADVVNGAQVLHLLCAAMVIDFTCADGRF